MMKIFLFSIPKNILRCFTGYNWLWHIIAIVLTFVLVKTDADWHYFICARSMSIRYLFFPALVLGGLLPITVPLYLVVSGHIIKVKIRQTLGWALGQSACIGSIISSVYKAFTGRVQPNLYDTTHNTSHGFNFGFLKHGIFWGWPSSHTTIAFAMALTLIKLFPKKRITAVLCLCYALYIGSGVSFSIHWLSEYVAGAIIGSLIGMVVANSYKNEIGSGN